jgi:hypothetical protein
VRFLVRHSCELVDNFIMRNPHEVLSQRTVAGVKRIFEQLMLTKDMKDVLYEHGLPDWFIRQMYERYNWNWMEALWALRSGDFFWPRNQYGDEVETIIPEGPFSSVHLKDLGEWLIRKLAAVAVVLSIRGLPSLGLSLSRSLELDGFVVDEKNEQLIPLEGPISARQEEDRLTRLVNKSELPNPHVVLQHIEDANSLYTEGKGHSSLGESRSLIQALIDGVSTETDTYGKHSTKLPGGTGPRIEYLRNVGFLTPDEQTAFNSAWGMLSSGSHPGVPEQEQARIGLILALEFGQLLLMKFNNWKNNGYSSFS